MLTTNNNFFVFKLIPSFITIISLLLGLSAIKVAIDNNVILAIYLILAAAICDLLDGRVARILNATSEFGGELDSLSDFATFCVAPAFILYYCLLDNAYPLGWISCCFFIVAGLLRLARFNILNDDKETNSSYANFFMGVPVPAGALLSLFPFYIGITYGIHISTTLVVIYLIIISLLMVSNIPTLSTKKFHINKRFSIIILAVLSLFILLLIYYTLVTLMVCSIIYLASIPVTVLLFFKQKNNFLKQKI